MLEGIGAIRAERMHEQALLRPVSLEIVRGPEIAGRNAVPLDQPVVLGNTRMLEAGAFSEELLDIALDIQILLLLELCESRRQLEQIVIERRPRCREGEPISPHPSEWGVGERGDRLIDRRVRLHGARIGADDPIPVGLVPAEIVEIEGDDRLLLIDRAHLQDVRLPAQAVEQFHHALAVAHHVGLGRAGVVQVGQRDVAHALA